MSSFIRNIRSYFVFDKRSKLSSGANTNKKVIFQKLKTTKVIDDRWRFLFFVANGEIDTNLAYSASKSIILMLAKLELTWQKKKKKLKRFASVGPSALPYSALDGIFNGLIIDCNFPEMTTFLPLFFVFLCRSIAADIASSSLRRELREKEFGFLSRIGLLEQCSSSCCCSAVNCFSSASSRGQQTTTTNFFFAKVSKEEAKN